MNFKFLSDPENELLQVEWRWFWRFMRSWQGCVLFLLQVGLIFLGDAFGVLIIQQIVVRLRSFSLLMPRLFQLSGVLSTFVHQIPWMYLFQRRVLNRLSEPAKEDLLVMPVNGRILWPALLLAPLLWGTVIYFGAYWVAQAPVLFFHRSSSVPPSIPAYYLPALSLLFQLQMPAGGFTLTVLMARWVWRNSNVALFWAKTLLALMLMDWVGSIFSGISMLFHTGSSSLSRYLLPNLATSLFLFYLGYAVLRGMRSERGWAIFLLQTKGKEEFVPPTPDFKRKGGGLSFVLSAFTRSFLSAFALRILSIPLARAIWIPGLESLFLLGPVILGIGLGLYFSRGILAEGDEGVFTVLGFFAAGFGALVGSLGMLIGGAS